MGSMNLTTRPPWYIMETPMMQFRDVDMPFWVWLVVAGGALIVIIIIILIIVLLCMCRSNRNHFWCCCFSSDESTTTFVDKPTPSDFAYGRNADGVKRSQILYRYPEDEMGNLGAASGQTMNDNYVPTAHRLTSGRNLRVVDDGFERPVIGGTVNSSRYGRPNGPVVTEYIDVDEPVNTRQGGNQLAVVTIGKPASVISNAPRPASAIGHHSASLQIGGGGSAAAATSIWPAL